MNFFLKKILFIILSVAAFTLSINFSYSSTEITGLRFGVHGDKTRIVFDLSKNTNYNVIFLPDPYRVVIDFNKTNWSLSGRESVATKGLIKSHRHGQFTPETFRVVLDVSGPVKLAQKFMLKPSHGKAYRLVVDLKRSNRSQFLADAKNLKKKFVQFKKSNPVAEQPLIAQPQVRKDGKKVIVIDPGHGGVDPGAIGITGVREKDVVLSVSKTLKRTLEKTGRYKVVLTRNRDVYVKLRDRIRIARRHNASLFMSIHADSIRKRHVRGASIYTLSEKASDKEAAALAAKENRADLIAGIDLSDENDDVSTILIDLAQRETMNLSFQLATIVVKEFKKVIRLLPRTHRQAGFVVLKAPDIPSVLIELGYLSNKYDERFLKNRKNHLIYAKALTKSVDNYFKKNKSY